MNLKSLLCIASVFISFCLHGQSGIGIGYNVGSFVSGLRNLEVLTYEFNLAHPNYTDHFAWRNITRGPVLKVQGESDEGGIEFMWSMKRIKADAEGADFPGDTVKRHVLKAKLNSLNSGIYWKAHDRVRIGLSYDLGMFKILKKVGPEDDFGDAKWTKLYNKKGRFNNWFTFFVDFSFGDDVRLSVRPYYQAQVLPTEFAYGSGISSTTYTFRTGNAGISIIGIFGEKLKL